MSTPDKSDLLAPLLGPDEKQYVHRDVRSAEEWKWKQWFLASLTLVLVICVAGLGYYASRRIIRDLPPPELARLTGQAYMTNYGALEMDTYNGSGFVLTEVRVSISVWDDKKSAVISNRVYRLPAYGFYPQQSRRLSADLGFILAQDQMWQFSIVGAKGRPE